MHLRWHAAAAAQHHLDGMAVLGGVCTGTGVAPTKTGVRFVSIVPLSQYNPA
jgi:hypothetical protein